MEDLPLSLSARDSQHEVRIRSIHQNGHETIEILSDSEDEPEACIIPGLGDDLSRTSTPSDTVTLVGDTGDFGTESESDEYIPNSQDMASDDEIELPSDTVWLDQDVISRVSDKQRRLNRQLVVDRVEYVTGLPSYWPVPRVKTAYIVDLRDPKYNIYDGDGNLLTVDAIIKNKVSSQSCCHHVWTDANGTWIRIKTLGVVQLVMEIQKQCLTSLLESQSHVAEAAFVVLASTHVNK